MLFLGWFGVIIFLAGFAFILVFAVKSEKDWTKNISANLVIAIFTGTTTIAVFLWTLALSTANEEKWRDHFSKRQDKLDKTIIELKKLQQFHNDKWIKQEALEEKQEQTP